MPYAPSEHNLIPEIIGHTADEMRSSILDYKKNQDQRAFNTSMLDQIMRSYPGMITPDVLKSVSGDANKASGTVAVLLQKIKQDQENQQLADTLKNRVQVTGMTTASGEKIAGIEAGSRKQVTGMTTSSGEKIAGLETGSREKITDKNIKADEGLKGAQKGALETATEKQKRAGTIMGVMLPDGTQVPVGLYRADGSVDPAPVAVARSMHLPPGKLTPVNDKDGRLVGFRSDQPDGTVGYHSVGADPTAVLSALGLLDKKPGTSTPAAGATPGASPSATPGATPGATPLPPPGPGTAPTPRPAMGGYIVGRSYGGHTYLGGEPTDGNSWK